MIAETFMKRRLLAAVLRFSPSSFHSIMLEGEVDVEVNWCIEHRIKYYHNYSNVCEFSSRLVEVERSHCTLHLEFKIKNSA